MAIDPDALASSLRRLATLGQPGSSVVEGLRHVTEACVDLFGVSGSGIMLADEQNIPRYVAASDGPGRLLEIAESETGQGPCTEAFVNNAVVASTDVTAEPRWPDLAKALRPHGVRAVLGLPVRLEPQVSTVPWSEVAAAVERRLEDVIGLATRRAGAVA